MPGNNTKKAGKRRYRFSDADRARSQEARKPQYVETALTCDACHASATCHAFKAGDVCTIISDFQGFESKNARDVVARIREIINELEPRAYQNLYFEKLNGGIATPEVTKLFGTLIKHYRKLADLLREMAPSKDAVVLDPESVLGKIFSPRRHDDGE